MKLKYFILSALYFLTGTLYASAQPCIHANSNISYIKVQTQKAIETEEISKAKFYAYRALNAIEKIKGQLKSCDCDDASNHIFESLEHLKSATRAISLDRIKILLKEALKSTEDGLTALEKHNLDTSDVLSLNILSPKKEKCAAKLPENDVLKEEIDKSLVNFKNSLDKVVNTVDCPAAYEFTKTIYDTCEKQLARSTLSDAKRYYNLKTRAIALKALQKLENCAH